MKALKKSEGKFNDTVCGGDSCLRKNISQKKQE